MNKLFPQPKVYPQFIRNIGIQMYGQMGLVDSDLEEIDKRYHENTLRIDADGDYIVLEDLEQLEAAEKESKYQK